MSELHRECQGVMMMCGCGSWGRRSGGGRPRKERPVVNICVEPVHPVTVFSLMFVLHRNGIWTPEDTPDHTTQKDLLDAFRTEVLEPRGVADDDEVWPLVEALNVGREQADQAAAKQLPGYAFYWNYNVEVFDSFDAEFVPGRRFCVDPALALGVLARLNDGFYRCDRSPDYTIGNLCEKGAAFGDPRLPGERMYPLWQNNSRHGR